MGSTGQAKKALKCNNTSSSHFVCQAAWRTPTIRMQRFAFECGFLFFILTALPTWLFFSVFHSAGFWISHVLSVLQSTLVSADFTSNWCSSSLVDWWKYSSIYCWTAVGGASLEVWLLWEELHWRCDCCGRSFTVCVVVVGGASLYVWCLWEELQCKEHHELRGDPPLTVYTFD